MKKPLVMSIMFVLAASLLFSQEKAASSEPSARQIVEKCVKALGGSKSVSDLQTLRVSAIYPDHGTTPLVVELKRPNFSRNPGIDMVFDGKTAVMRKGNKNNPKPIVIDEGDLVDFEVEIGNFIPAFLDYPATYLGKEEMEGKLAYKLQVVFPRGAKMVYFIDSEGFLPLKAVAEFTMRGTRIRAERLFSNYKKVGGLWFPHTFTYQGRSKEVQTATVTKMEVNPIFPKDNFAMPAGVQ